MQCLLKTKSKMEGLDDSLGRGLKNEITFSDIYQALNLSPFIIQCYSYNPSVDIMDQTSNKYKKLDQGYLDLVWFSQTYKHTSK